MRLFFIALVLTAVADYAQAQNFERTVFDGPGSDYFTRYEWVDFNGDGATDILAIDPFGQASLYMAANGTYEGFGINIENLHFNEGRYGFRDQDGDGDVDILTSRGNSLVILNFNGSNGFTLAETGITYTDVDYGNVYWIDIDGDLLPDVIHGRKVFLKRAGNYAESWFVFPELLSHMVFDDMDADGLADLVAGGYDSYDGTTITIYSNLGDGVFSTTGTELPETNLKSQTITLLDADRDGDIDVFAIDRFARGFVFTNNLAQSGHMTFSASQIFENVSISRSKSGDINADGLEDLIASGTTSLHILTNTTSTTTITFTHESPDIAADNLHSFDLVDFDGDNDLDIHVKGSNWYGTENLMFVKTGPIAGGAPAVPSGISSAIGQSRTLSWNLTPGIMYNLEVKRNGLPYLPSATSSVGKLFVRDSKLIRSGSLSLQGLAAGSYEWRLQAVDPSGRVSAFSSANTFTILDGPSALTLQASDLTKVKLCWTYNGTGTPSFAIFRGSASGPPVEIAQVAAGISCYEDNVVPANQAVKYFVAAKNAGIYSAPSNTVEHYSSMFIKSQFGMNDPNIISSRCFPADYDLDGDYDLEFIGRVGSFHNNYLLKNDGNGGYSSHGSLITADAIHAPYTEMQAPRDLDNDGDTDIAVIIGEDYSWQKIAVFINNNGTFLKSFETPSYLGVRQFATEDFNSDGLPDLLFSHVIGNSPGNPTQYKLLYQTATGDFTDSHIEFSSGETSSTNYFRCADLNNDGFIDLLWTNGEESKMRIQANEGGMTFTWKTSSLPATTAMGIGDYNGDGHADIMTQGNEGLHLYSGRGDFTFTDPKVIPVSYLSGSTSYVNADIDLNGLSDLLLSDGYNAHVMLNRGNGSFKNSDIELQRNWGTSIAVTDFDNDGDIDIVKPGNDGQHQGLNYYYKNQLAEIDVLNAAPSAPGPVSASYASGKAVFTWTASTDDRTPATLLTYNLHVVDANGKVWLSAETNEAGTFRRRMAPGNAGQSMTKTLNNLPAGTYTARVQAIDASFSLSTWSPASQLTIDPGPTELAIERILLNKVNLAWKGSAFNETAVIVERKTTETEWEVLATLPAGTTSYTDEGLEYYQLYHYRIFESTASKTTAMSNIAEWNSDLWVVADGEMPNLWGSMDVADFTGDGRMDLVLNGGMIYNGYYEDITRATFENTANGWVKQDITPSALTHTAGISFIDLNGDSKLDIYQHGYIWNVGYRTETFINNGTKTFSPQTNLFTENIYSLHSSFDFDMDNDNDLVVARADVYPVVRELLKNNGDGNFETVSPCHSCPGSGLVADFDRDGDEDVIRESGGSYVLFLNTPTGLIETSATFPMYENRLAVVDYNDDSFPDVVLLTSSHYHGGKIYRNLGVPDGSNGPSFTALPVDLSSGDASVRFADFDHDGRTDLVVLSPRIKVLMNKGNDTFVEHQIPGYRISLHVAGVLDYDNDGDLDVYLSGYHIKDFSDYGRKAKILLNQLIVSGKGTNNAPPAAPGQLSATQDSLGVHLSWSKPADDHTDLGMTYDVVLYRDGKTITKGALDPLTGSRLRLTPGKSTGTATLNNLLIGPYSWRVQSVDGSFAGSPLSAEGTFVFLPPPPIIRDTTIYLCGRSVALSADGTNIQWYSDRSLTQLIASGTFHPTESQSVYVTQTINGYRGIAKKVNITIVNKPSSPVLTEPNPIILCKGWAGGVRILYASGENVRWYADQHLQNVIATGNNASVMVSESESYFVTQTIGGCESDPLRIDVELIDIDPRIYFKGGNLWSRGEEGDRFYWYKNGFFHAFTTVPYIPFDGETATYVVSVSKGHCSEVSAPFVSSEENITAVESPKTVYFEVYPNPATLRVVVRAKESNATFKVFDARGILVHSFAVDKSGEKTIDTSRWNRGLYMIVAGDSNNGFMRRLMLL